MRPRIVTAMHWGEMVGVHAQRNVHTQEHAMVPVCATVAVGQAFYMQISMPGPAQCKARLHAALLAALVAHIYNYRHSKGMRKSLTFGLLPPAGRQVQF